MDKILMSFGLFGRELGSRDVVRGFGLTVVTELNVDVRNEAMSGRGRCER